MAAILWSPPCHSNPRHQKTNPADHVDQWGSGVQATPTLLLLRLLLLRLRIRRQQRLDQRAVRPIVHADHAFLAARGDHGAVRARADRIHEISRPAEVADRAAAGVERFDLAVAAAGEEFQLLADK